jgi:hypothetical protein
MEFALVLLDLDTSDVREPLAGFQLTPFKKKDLSELVVEINARVGDPLYGASIRDSFEADWKELEAQMTPPPLPSGGEKAQKSPTNEILQEILQKVRTIERTMEASAARERATWTSLPSLSGTVEPSISEFQRGLVEAAGLSPELLSMINPPTVATIAQGPSSVSAPAQQPRPRMKQDPFKAKMKK